MNPILKRFGRALLAVIIPQIFLFIPEVAAILPAPYNLIFTPFIMSIGKGLRDWLNPSNDSTHWTNWIPV